MAIDPWAQDIIDHCGGLCSQLYYHAGDFLESGVVLKILGETVALKQWEITGELRKRIKVSFEQEGIEMPSLQRFMNTLPNTGL